MPRPSPRLFAVVAALVLAACGAEPSRYYETTGLLHRPVAPDDRDALVAEVGRRMADRAVTVRAPGQRARRIDRAALRTLDPPVLQALFLVLTGDFSGAEIDLLVRSADKRDRPVTAYVAADGAVELRVGEPGTLPPVEARDIGWFRAHGTGPLREEGAKWDAYARHVLALALVRLDREERAVVEEVPFVRAPADRGRSDRGAQYVQENCRASIRVFDRAFAARRVQFVGPVERPLPGPVMALLHELGHALHNRPGRLAFCEYEFMLADRNRRAEALGPRIDAFNALVPRANRGEAKARAEIERLQGPIAAEQAAIAKLDGRIEAALARARSLGKRGPVIDAWVAAVGEGAPTDYGRSSPIEAFAEAFALYKADPEALRRALPAAHAFFASGRHVRAMTARR